MIRKRLDKMTISLDKRGVVEDLRFWVCLYESVLEYRLTAGEGVRTLPRYPIYDEHVSSVQSDSATECVADHVSGSEDAMLEAYAVNFNTQNRDLEINKQDEAEKRWEADKTENPLVEERNGSFMVVSDDEVEVSAMNVYWGESDEERQVKSGRIMEDGASTVDMDDVASVSTVAEENIVDLVDASPVDLVETFVVVDDVVMNETPIVVVDDVAMTESRIVVVQDDSPIEIDLVSPTAEDESMEPVLITEKEDSPDVINLVDSPPAVDVVETIVPFEIDINLVDIPPVEEEIVLSEAVENAEDGLAENDVKSCSLSEDEDDGSGLSDFEKNNPGSKIIDDSSSDEDDDDISQFLASVDESGDIEQVKEGLRKDIDKLRFKRS
jgi:hypothetical protein